MTDPNVLFQEAACLGCHSDASMADMLRLALLDRISTGSGGGGAGVENISGAGSPVGVVTPDAVNQWYYDTVGIAWWWSTGLTNADWTQAI